MIFVINKLKYDTVKMELVSDKIKYSYTWVLTLTGTKMKSMGRDVKLFKSKKDNWLITYRTDYDQIGKSIEAEEAKQLLLQYDLEKYEELFGDLEEA